MKPIALLLLFYLSSPIVYAESNQADLEVRQRDIVIGEMAEIIFHFSKNFTQEELVQYLTTTQKVTHRARTVTSEGNYVFWGSTVKFEFNNGSLVNVYW